jgi:hypothetical protein
MASDVTNNFGFKKFRDGGMVYGKDLNDILEDIDDKLGQSLGAITEAGAAENAAIGSAAWAQVVLDDEKEIIFASQVVLTKARLIAVDGLTTIGANKANVVLALASAPTTPITEEIDVEVAGVDALFAFLAETTVDADDEIIVLEKDDADSGFVATADYQVVVEGNKVTT